MRTLHDMEIELNRKRCRRCSHEWIPRRDNPALCPKCHSPYWNEVREGDNGQDPAEDGPLLVVRVDQELLGLIDKKAARSRFSSGSEWIVWAIKEGLRDRHARTSA